MKRIFVPVLVLALIVGAAFIFIRKEVAKSPEPVAEWLPAGTLFFDDMPDIHRSRDRWPLTALGQIVHEPEVQAFLQRPRDTVPGYASFNERRVQERQIDPGQFFIAVTDWSGNAVPKAIAGLSYAGDKDQLDALVGELRRLVQAQWPSGKWDVDKYGAGDIETFTTPDFTAALAYRGQWLFLATDPDLLKSTIDRYEGKPGPDSLAGLAQYKSCLEHLPDQPDNVLFLRPGEFADKLQSMALMLNPTADTGGMDQVKKIDAVGVALKMDGAVMRDAAYIIEPPPAGSAPLAKDVLRLSSSNTIIATSERFGALGDMQMPDPKTDPSGMLQLLQSYVKAFTSQGLGPDQFAQAFGPETGFLLDWPSDSMIPGAYVMADVQDRVKAQKFLDTLPNLPLSAGVNFAHIDSAGVSYYSLPQTGIGFVPLQVTLGLTDKALIGGLSMGAVKAAAGRWDASGGGLQDTDTYKAAAALVQEPTLSFSYLDTKAIFDRVYGLFRGVASMGFVPHLTDFVDVGKLPDSETISKHLSPIVSSGAVKDGGVLVESAGPVTMMQAAMATGSIVGVAAVQIITQQLKGQSVTFPGFPGFGPLGPKSGGIPFAIPTTPGISTPQSAPVAPVPGGSPP